MYDRFNFNYLYVSVTKNAREEAQRKINQKKFFTERWTRIQRDFKQKRKRDRSIKSSIKISQIFEKSFRAYKYKDFA